MLTILFNLALLVFLLWLAARLFLQGADHSQYDKPFELTGQRSEPSPEHVQIVETMKADAANQPKMSNRERLPAMRKQFDDMGATIEFDGEIRPININGLAAEWVMAPGADPDRRLLYLHGGAYTVGSPLSHRSVTTEYASRLGISVLAIDYRLMPEHPRSACIEDSQNAYRWILENGPDGPATCKTLFVSGDSAGGNLTLMTLAWARDEDLRQADAAVALSPGTDSTLGSPSMKANVETDTMLGPMMGPMVKIPRIIILWVTLLTNRMRPNNPLLSPLHGDLSGLPPTLVHASAAEMLLDDGVRWVNKARDQGSPAELGVWPFMLHVWHVFLRDLPEGREAFDHIESFLRPRLQ